MVITYHGENYFRLQSGSFTILVDPTNLRSAKGSSAIVSTAKLSAVPPTDETVWVDNQGEYEIKGLHLRGWSALNDGKYERTLYLLETDEMNIVLFGSLGKIPEEKVLKLLKKPDIAIVGFEKKAALGETAVAKFVKSLDPSIVILGAGGDTGALLKEFKKNSCEKMEKFVVKKKDIAENETKIICLKA